MVVSSGEENNAYAIVEVLPDKNIIITDIIDNSLFVPIECVHTEDSISYVVSGSTRKQVIVGKSNENEIIIKAGLEEGDDIYLVPPEGYNEFRLSKLPADIIEKHKKENEKIKTPATTDQNKESGENAEMKKPDRKGKGGKRGKARP